MNTVRHKEFTRQISKVPRVLQEKAYERLLLLVKDERHPLLNNHKLGPPYAEYRSINITGDWRLVYRRIDSETIYLRAIGTHHQLYGS